MVIRLGRNGRFLARSLYPEHKESRPLPGEEPELPALAGVGEPCPTCGETEGGVLAVKRGRFGPFVGCNRYPECAYIKKDGPPPPEQLPFNVVCPRCGEGHLVARRARRTGSVFWGCSRYPKCDFTSSREPLGPVHDVDQGPVARRDEESGLCLTCGARVPLPGGAHPGAGDVAARWPGRPGGAGAARRSGRTAGGRSGDSRTCERRGRGVPAPGPGGRGAAATAGGDRPRRPAAGVRHRLSPGVDDPPPLEKFLASLAARDTSPHTQRAYRTAVGAYLEWLAAAGAGWRTPSRTVLRAYLAELGDGRARSSVAQRLAAIRFVPPLGATGGPRRRRPLGCARNAAPPAPPAAGPHRGRGGAHRRLGG